MIKYLGFEMIQTNDVYDDFLNPKAVGLYIHE